MAKRQAKELYPTMKAGDVDSDNELEISFEEVQATIVAIKDQPTKFGDSVIATLETDKKFNVFINNNSMKNLIEAYGDDDKNWVGKLVDLKKETNEEYDKDMIVLHPVK